MAGTRFSLKNRGLLLFIVLGGFFIANALIAEMVGVKIFALEDTFGWEPFNWNLFGQKGSLSFTAGVLLWPVVFVMTDVINEYYGKKGVRILSYLTVLLIIYAFIMIFAAIKLAPADWWVGSAAKRGIADRQAAFASIFGQGLWIIGGSLVAFLVGQLVDAAIFQKIRLVTGEGKVWLRALVSTIVSQGIDSYIVIYIAFVVSPEQWTTDLWLAISTVNYGYKIIAAIVLLPVIYFMHWIIDAYLGKELADEMREAARS